MSTVKDDLRYAESHEWVKLEGDIATVGISDYAQHALGDIVYVDMPEVGDEVEAGEVFGAVESVKAASDLLSRERNRRGRKRDPRGCPRKHQRRCLRELDHESESVRTRQSSRLFSTPPLTPSFAKMSNRFIPHTDSDIAAMLKRIGVATRRRSLCRHPGGGGIQKVNTPSPRECRR